jgi:hypothetical protein
MAAPILYSPQTRIFLEVMGTFPLCIQLSAALEVRAPWKRFFLGSGLAIGP